MRLVLEDGSAFAGSGFGATVPVAGEVVFSTAMTGYVESLTDPSYRGQILVLTYPIVGSYGVPKPRAPRSIDPPYESEKIQIQGLVVQHYLERHSHRSGERSLGQWLMGENVPGVTGVDTRALTEKLRERGTMRGWLLPNNYAEKEGKAAASSIDMEADVFDLVAPEAPVEHGSGDQHILLVDAGAKDNIVRSLVKRRVRVTRAPWHADIVRLAKECDGVMIGNGPGDPKKLAPLVEQLRLLLGGYERPIFGVCLGHQLLALAAGGDTGKLPYGHRGVNQPVQDLLTRRCYITSQNHGYAVKDASLPADWEPWFVNLNDGTNEGIRCRTRPFFSVQFHPEGSPGPEDTNFLFDDFLRLVGAMKR